MVHARKQRGRFNKHTKWSGNGLVYLPLFLDNECWEQTQENIDNDLDKISNCYLNVQMK